MLKTPISNIRTILSHPAAFAREHIGRLHGRAANLISRLLPETNSDIATMKQDVWTDLSHLYYKYDHDFQKRAFREVMKEMSEMITEGKWAKAYRRIYRNNKTTPLEPAP